MTQDNNYIEEPVVVQRVTETTDYTVPPVYEAVEPVRRRHPGLIPLALSSLLGLLSLFLPFWSLTQHFTREWFAPNYATGAANASTGDLLYQRFTEHTSGSFWNLGQGVGQHHTFLLILLALALLLALVAAFSGGAAWARSLAGILGILSGLYLLWQGFTHGGLGRFLATGVTNPFGSGFGRWLMILAGLALLATGLWSLLGKVRDAADDVVATTAYNN